MPTINPNQNLFLSTIEHQTELEQFLSEHPLDDQTTEALCKLVADLETEIKQSYEDGYSEGYNDGHDGNIL